MTLEHLSVCCDRCVANLTDVTDDALRKLAFRSDPAHNAPDLFTNHAALSRVISAAGWYIDAQQTLCPKHYTEVLATYQQQDEL